MNASIGSISTIDEDDEDNRRPKFAGLGTVISGQYLITAYHVLRNRIDKIYDIIVLHLVRSTRQREIRQMISTTYADMHAKDFSELVDMFVTKHRMDKSNNVKCILQQISKFINIEDLNSKLSSVMKENKCVVEFRCGKFIIDWKILYGDKKKDLAMVQLIKSSILQNQFPDSMLLGNQDSLTQNLIMRVVQVFETQIVTKYLTCQTLSPNEFQKHKQDAKWRDDEIFDPQRLVFRTEEWFERGTSGSSIIQRKQNQAHIHAIFQKMHPKQYFEKNGYERLGKDWEQLLGSGRKIHDFPEILDNNKLLNVEPVHNENPLQEALYTACRTGDTEFVNMILEDGADVNICDRNGCTPLEIAVAGSQMEVINILLSKGADVNKCGTAVSASTPLCTACRDGNLDIVRRLIAAGADISKSDGYGRSPLQHAEDGNYDEIIRLFEQNS